LIIDVPQSPEDFRPGHPSKPGRPSIGFAQVEMSEPSLGLKNRVAEAVFLDVYMKRVEEDLAIGAFDTFCECDSLGRSVHDEMLEAIDDFKAKDDVAVFRGFDGLAHPLNRSIGEDSLVFAWQKFARP
jgi:hypothetical protein